MNSDRPFAHSDSSKYHSPYLPNHFARRGLPSSTSNVQRTLQREDLGLHSWHWPALDPGPSNQSFGTFGTAPALSKVIHGVECDPEYQLHRSLQRSPTKDCDIRPLSFCPSHWEADHTSPLSKKGLVFSCSPCEGPEPGSVQSDVYSLSPQDWQHKVLLASPFSEDSDSDDSLAPSPFSSPEFSNAPDDVEDEQRSPLCFLPALLGEPRYHHLEEYPSLQLHHDIPEDTEGNPAWSLSPTLLDLETKTEEESSFANDSSEQSIELPLSPLDNCSSFELGLQSPSLQSLSLPVFNSHSYYDTLESIPDSPHHRSLDLPSLDSDLNFHSGSLGLSSFTNAFDDSPSHHEFAGYPQRTTWLSLPGADTDDDLIPIDLASKNYIPDPSLAISTMPSSRSLLIWDPTTHSGLPPGLPTFDGTGRSLSHRLMISEMSSSPEDNFEVDPSVVAELAEIDAEKGEEAQKLCELRQRTTAAAVAAAAIASSKIGNKEREGAQWEAEKVKERWRELTALLRLKLKSERKKDGSSSLASSSHSSSTEDGDHSSSLTDSNETKTSSLNFRPSSFSTSTFPPIMESAEAVLDNSSTSSPTSPSQLGRRSSKPKITSMAQLVANMVFHRQQEVLRRSPSRSRTWPPPSVVSQPAAQGTKKSLTHATPKSPLSQMTLPDDVDELGLEVEGEFDSPLQLSPLCLTLHQSPESPYVNIEGPPTLSLAGFEG